LLKITVTVPLVLPQGKNETNWNLIFLLKQEQNYVFFFPAFQNLCFFLPKWFFQMMENTENSVKPFKSSSFYNFFTISIK
jgi:hypothetical protein